METLLANFDIFIYHYKVRKQRTNPVLCSIPNEVANWQGAKCEKQVSYVLSK